MHFRMSQSWSTSLSPGNRGSPVSISTAMQPAHADGSPATSPHGATGDCTTEVHIAWSQVMMGYSADWKRMCWVDESASSLPQESHAWQAQAVLEGKHCLRGYLPIAQTSMAGP